MKLSFVIPAYNEDPYIGPCLDSILRHSAGRYHEIIVVDNGSTDRTSEFAASRPGVRVVYEARRGITHARQRGLEEAAGDLIAYIDADTRIPPCWLDIAERTFNEDCELLCLSGPYRYYDGSLTKRLLNNIISLSVLPIGRFLFGYMLVGGNYIAKRRALVEAGGFDPSIDFFGEDTDIGRRLHLKGRLCFRFDFFIYSSARRFYGEGMFRANTVYLINYLWVVIFHRPLSKTHRDIRALYPSNRSNHATSSHFLATISRTLLRRRPLMPRSTETVTAAESIE